LYIASASDDRTIRIWNASGGLEVHATATREVTGNEEVSSVIMSDCRTLTGHRSEVNSVAVSSDGMVIVSGSNDHSVRVWDAQTGAAMLSPLLGHTHPVQSVAISSDGRLAASGSWDSTVRLWDLQTGKAVGEPMRGHSDWVRAVVFSPDAWWLASGSDDKTVRIWDVATQQPSKIGPFSCENDMLAVAVSPDGRFVAGGDLDGHLSIWQSDKGQPVGDPLQTNLDYVRSIGFSPDGARIVAGGSHVRVWNISVRELVFSLTGHSSTVWSATYSPDGRMIGTSSSDNTVRLWDAVTGAPIALLAGHSSYVISIAFTPDSHSVVSGSADRTIRVRDRTRAVIAYPASDGDVVTSLRATILDNGWLQSPSAELLLWVPTDYRLYLHAHASSPRVVVSFDKRGWHRGQSWTSCWLADASDPPAHVL